MHVLAAFETSLQLYACSVDLGMLSRSGSFAKACSIAAEWRRQALVGVSYKRQKNMLT